MRSTKWRKRSTSSSSTTSTAARPPRPSSFGLDGTTYEIDLNDKNAAKLRDALAGYVGHARKVPPRAAAARPAATTGGPSAKEMRDWARSNGYNVSDRGRVSAEVREAFDAAH